MRASNYHKTAVENTDRGGVIAHRKKVQRLRILEECAALARRRCAWLEDPDPLGAGMYSGIAREAARIAPEAGLP